MGVRFCKDNCKSEGHHNLKKCSSFGLEHSGVDGFRIISLVVIALPWPRGLVGGWVG